MSRRVIAGLVAVSALALSGCGSASPGVAVKVGDTSVRASQVDDLAVSYCKAIEPVLTGGGAVFPMSFVRAYVVRNLTIKAAAEQLAEHYDVEVPATYQSSLRDLRDTLAEQYAEAHVDEAVEVDAVQVYLPAVEIAVGEVLLAESGDTAADDQAKQERGADAMQQWLSEHPADINPRYGISVDDTALDRPEFIDTGTSFPLSDDAVNAEKIGSEEGPDPAYTSTLPSSQRCG